MPKSKPETDEQVVQRIIEDGVSLHHHPNWSKAEIEKSCDKMYSEMEAMRRWIIGRFMRPLWATHKENNNAPASSEGSDQNS